MLYAGGDALPRASWRQHPVRPYASSAGVRQMRVRAVLCLCMRGLTCLARSRGEGEGSGPRTAAGCSPAAAAARGGGGPVVARGTGGPRAGSGVDPRLLLSPWPAQSVSLGVLSCTPAAGCIGCINSHFAPDFPRKDLLTKHAPFWPMPIRSQPMLETDATALITKQPLSSQRPCNPGSRGLCARASPRTKASPWRSPPR